MRNIALLIILFTSLNLFSQGISVEVNTGLSGLSFNNPKATSSQGFGASIGGNYIYSLTENWNVIGGLHISMHTTKVSLQNGVYKSLEIDDTNSAFEFRVNTANYLEKHKLYTLNIPILAEYSAYAGRLFKLYISGGLKVLLPISQNITSEGGELKLSGYYADTNILVDDLPQHGFGKTSQWTDNNVPFKTTIALSLQSGLDFSIGKQKYYAGLYFDYGLNDISNSEKESSLISYSSKGINQTSSKGIANMSETESVKLTSYGLALRFFIN